MSVEIRSPFQAVLYSETVHALSSCVRSVPQISMKRALSVADCMFLEEDFVGLQPSEPRRKEHPLKGTILGIEIPWPLRVITANARRSWGSVV